MQVNIDLTDIYDVVNEKFHFLLTDKNRYIVCRGGAGSGKSYSIMQALVFKILNDYDKAPQHYLLLRKTFPAARKSILPLLKHILNEWGLNPIVEENKTNSSFTFSNGSILSIDSLDDPEKIKSVFGITKIFLEEANEFSIDDFRQLDLRMRGDKSANYQIYIAFNPISKESWLYNEFYTGGNKKTTLSHSTYKDNPHLDDDYIEQLQELETKDKHFYKVYTLGEWGVLEGLVYTDWSIIDEWPEDIKYFTYGTDFGFTAPTAITRVAIEGTGIYLDEAFYAPGYTNTQIIEFINNNLSVDEMYCDSAEPDRIKEMRLNHINAKKSRKNIKDGIDFVKNYHLYVTRRSTNVQRELNTYKWPNEKDGKNDKGLPVDWMNHSLDGVRYAAYTKWGKKRTFGVVT